VSNRSLFDVDKTLAKKALKNKESKSDDGSEAVNNIKEKIISEVQLVLFHNP
jgi:hypothetical protein